MTFFCSSARQLHIKALLDRCVREREREIGVIYDRLNSRYLKTTNFLVGYREERQKHGIISRRPQQQGVKKWKTRFFSHPPLLRLNTRGSHLYLFLPDEADSKRCVVHSSCFRATPTPTTRAFISSSTADLQKLRPSKAPTKNTRQYRKQS